MSIKARLNIGNSLFNCPIPLVLKDRYFFVEVGETEDLFTVFFLRDREPVFEIYRNEPYENPITEVTKTPPGVITVADRETGGFLDKVRPGYKGSSVFGRFKDEDAEILINDREIRVGTNRIAGNVLQTEVGIIVNEDGGFGLGSRIPPEARHLFVKR